MMFSNPTAHAVWIAFMTILANETACGDCKGSRLFYLLVPISTPLAKPMVPPKDETPHVGDFGKITTYASGISKGSKTERLKTLFGENSILGRTVVVYAGTKDLGKGGYEDFLKTGNAGGRLACGVVGFSFCTRSQL